MLRLQDAGRSASYHRTEDHLGWAGTDLCRVIMLFLKRARFESKDVENGFASGLVQSTFWRLRSLSSYAGLAASGALSQPV